MHTVIPEQGLDDIAQARVEDVRVLNEMRVAQPANDAVGVTVDIDCASTTGAGSPLLSVRQTRKNIAPDHPGAW